MKHRILLARSRGFSLVEVMVALIVISVGLLGVAKMQALALSSSSTSRTRSLAAIQAASLASSMHADRAYWTQQPMGTVTNVQGGVVQASGDANLKAAATAAAALASPADYCTQAKAGSVSPCTPVQMAGADLQSWAADLRALMPATTASITCDANPLTCLIQLTLYDNLKGVNTNTGPVGTNGTTQLQSTYTLYVQP